MTSTSVHPPTAEVLADAAGRRRTSTDSGVSGHQLMQEHERRQMFRRLIDPGIFRPNSKEVAMDSLKTLSTIADNILREPENTKYHSFKHENDTIKRRLIQPRGALEYALALGFSPKVMDFQSYYVFKPSKMEDLRVGAAILKEAIDRETEREERAQRGREEQKAAAAAAAQNVRLAFLDDRRAKVLRDERERQLRETRGGASGDAASRARVPHVRHAPSSSPHELDQSVGSMPGLGRTLASVDDDSDQPPPYRPRD